MLMCFIMLLFRIFGWSSVTISEFSASWRDPTDKSLDFQTVIADSDLTLQKKSRSEDLSSWCQWSFYCH